MAPLWPPSSRALAATRRDYMARRITLQACGTPLLPLATRLPPPARRAAPRETMDKVHPHRMGVPYVISRAGAVRRLPPPV